MIDSHCHLTHVRLRDVDLVIENPLPFAITVRARGERGQMVVELYGLRRVRRVDWNHTVLDTEAWSDRYVEDELVPPGEEQISQRGIRGFFVLRERTLHDRSGVHMQETHIRYPPTDRIIRVAPGALDPLTGNPLAGEPLADEPLNVPQNPF